MSLISFMAVLLTACNSPDAEYSKAWLAVEGANIRSGPSAETAIIGRLERDDPVRIRSCVPDCASVDGWALLEPFGAVKLRLLTMTAPGDPRPATDFVYGRVLAGGAVVRELPDPEGRELQRYLAGHILAFDASSITEEGWLRRVQGGYVQSGHVRVVSPSAFRGLENPPHAVAFFRRDTTVTVHDDGGPVSVKFDRRAWATVSGARDGQVQVMGIEVPRKSVQLAVGRRRPAGVPEGAKWVHIDLAEQTLTAYAGEVLVYATLVSTGKSGWETPPGLFAVWLKHRHGNMVGRSEPYHVEEVPSSMFFNRGIALHGAAWHEAFGTPVSHGCVNLSPGDAAWLFEWAPPPLPAGWHSILPTPAELETLWVHVEKRGADAALRLIAPVALR